MAPAKTKEDVTEDVEMTEAASTKASEDETMQDQEDAPASGQGGEEDYDDEDEEEEDEEPKIRRLPGATATAASFEFLEEGHTLGNALRYVIMKNPDVEFCAYAIPHPSEARMNVRIQTYPPANAVDALEKGLRDLQELSDVVAEKFIAARDSYSGPKASVQRSS